MTPSLGRGATRTALTLGVLIGLASSAAPAHAGSDVGIVVTGESWIQPQLVTQIESWLTLHGHTLVPSPLPPEAVDALDQCVVNSDQTCARGLVEQRAGSTGLLYAHAESKPRAAGAPDVTLTAYWFDKGHDPVAEHKTCPRCTDQTLRTTAEGLLKKLIGGADLGHVKLKSAPPGARISIDGQAIGVTPLDWDLPPGKHAIRMDKPGLKPQSQDVLVESNQSKLVVLTLPVDPGDHGSGSTLPRWVPLAATITGGAALVAGGVLIAIDQDQDTSSRPAHRFYRDTAPAGVGLAIGGAVLGGVGAYWLLFRSPKTASAPVAALTSDTAYIGWLGRF